MKEYGMIFSGPMVRAILDGTKTQTRRIIKPQPKDWTTRYGKPWPCIEKNGLVEYQKCPHGEIGDRIWVRETWWEPPFITHRMLRNGADTWPKCDYDIECDNQRREEYREWGWKRKPSIFMPRWASRIDLEILNIWPEKIQDISEEDAKKEGVVKEFRIVVMRPDGGPDYSIGLSYKGGFANLWDSLNAKKGYGWDKNLWVFVREFRRIKP